LFNFILKNKNENKKKENNKKRKKKKLPLLDSTFWMKQTQTTFLDYIYLSIYIYYAFWENLNHFGMKVIGLFLFIFYITEGFGLKF